MAQFTSLQAMIIIMTAYYVIKMKHMMAAPVANACQAMPGTRPTVFWWSSFADQKTKQSSRIAACNYFQLKSIAK